MKIVSAQEAVSHVSSNNRVFFQGAAMTPNTLIEALCNNYMDLDNVEIVQIHTEGEALYTQEPYSNSFNLSSFFVGKNVRASVNSKSGDYIPIFLSEIGLLFQKGILPLDVAFIHVSPPDKHGYCSLGTSVDITLAALRSAKLVIAQVNPKVPRTHGDGIIHIKNIDFGVEVNLPIHQSLSHEPSKTEAQIGKHVAGLIEDGATLQMGIGNIPNAVLRNLTNHKRLGIHTEMFSDGILPLVAQGVITGE